MTSWTISGWIKINEMPPEGIGGVGIVGKRHNADQKYNYTVMLDSPWEYDPASRLSSPYEVDGDETDYDPILLPTI